MTRVLSHRGRQYAEGEAPQDYPVALIEITHPDLAEVLRFSTDDAEEISFDPYRRGIRSTWRGADPETEPFYHVGAQVEWSGEFEQQGPEARLILSAINVDVIEALRSVATPATCHLAKVMASDPDTVEEEVLNLDVVGAESDMASLVVVLQEYPSWLDPFPAVKMTPQNFPALFR